MSKLKFWVAAMALLALVWGCQSPIADLVAKASPRAAGDITLTGSTGSVVLSGMTGTSLTVSYTPGSAIDSARLFVSAGNSTGLVLASQAMTNNGGVYSYTFSHASFTSGVKIYLDVLKAAAGVETNVPQGVLGDVSTWAFFTYASSTSTTYTVTFDGQGATTAPSPATKTVTSPATTVGSLPTAPAKTGFTFGGWYTAVNGGGTAFTATTAVTANLTVYAKWTATGTGTTLTGPNGTLVVSGMTGTNLTVSYTPGSAIDSARLFVSAGNSTGLVLASQAMTNSSGTYSYTFSHPSFTSGVQIYVNVLKAAAGVETNVPQGTLATVTTWASFNYATSTPTSYTVTYDSQGATVAANPTSQTVTSPATTVGTLPAPPTKTGSSFGGWFTAVNGGGTAFTATTAVTANLTVYAKWNTGTSYTVTYDSQGGTAATPSSQTVTAPATTVGTLPTAPTKSGATFGGWYTAVNGGGTAFTATTTVSASLTVYAKWNTTGTSYTVTYDSQGGTGSTPTSQTVTSPATTVGTLPSNPSKSGQTFGGWFTAVNGGGTLFTSTTTVTASLTVYAKWSPVGTIDFGPNVIIFDPSMSAATIQAKLDQIFLAQQTTQFSNNRYAIMFKPGTYSASVNVGYYMQILGLGRNVDDVLINGSIQSDGATVVNHNVTENFWRAVENIAVAPTSWGRDMWAVSQAAPARRFHVKGDLWLFDINPANGASGWASGGFMADSWVDGAVNPGGQQQWLSRNSKWTSSTGGVWNMVFVGDNNAPATSFGAIPSYTTLNQTPVVREKPYLYVDSAGAYNVLVPSIRTNSQGISWASGSTPGTSIPITQFYIANAATDTAATINAALSTGKHLLLTPGVYNLTGTINVTNANTVVLGLGMATLVNTTSLPAMTVADVDGVTIAGILFDAGTVNSPYQLQVGPTGSSASHSSNPTLLADIFFRVGGAIAGKTTTSLIINSSDVIGDDFWIWRADHGNAGTWGWTINTSDNGLIVNGNNVTIYGLFVEHYQKYQTIWNGNGGRVYFYQSEIPYDVPNQAAWMNGSIKGYASYKVANTVTSHTAYGVGVYCFFNVNAALQLESAIEVPASGLNGAMFHNMVTVALGSAGAVGQINHVINSQGAMTNDVSTPTYLVQ